MANRRVQATRRTTDGIQRTADVAAVEVPTGALVPMARSEVETKVEKMKQLLRGVRIDLEKMHEGIKSEMNSCPCVPPNQKKPETILEWANADTFGETERGRRQAIETAFTKLGNKENGLENKVREAESYLDQTEPDALFGGISMSGVAGTAMTVLGGLSTLHEVLQALKLDKPRKVRATEVPVPNHSSLLSGASALDGDSDSDFKTLVLSMLSMDVIAKLEEDAKALEELQDPPVADFLDFNLRIFGLHDVVEHAHAHEHRCAMHSSAEDLVLGGPTVNGIPTIHLWTPNSTLLYEFDFTPMVPLAQQPTEDERKGAKIAFSAAAWIWNWAMRLGVQAGAQPLMEFRQAPQGQVAHFKVRINTIVPGQAPGGPRAGSFYPDTYLAPMNLVTQSQVFVQSALIDVDAGPGGLQELTATFLHQLGHVLGFRHPIPAAGLNDNAIGYVTPPDPQGIMSNNYAAQNGTLSLVEAQHANQVYDDANTALALHPHQGVPQQLTIPVTANAVTVTVLAAFPNPQGNPQGNQQVPLRFVNP